MATRKTTPAPTPSTLTRKVLRVEYTDGTTDDVNPSRPKLLIAFELEHGVQQPETHAQIAWLGWHGLGRPDGDLDTWLDRVETISVVEVAAGKASS